MPAGGVSHRSNGNRPESPEGDTKCADLLAVFEKSMLLKFDEIILIDVSPSGLGQRLGEIRWLTPPAGMFRPPG